MADGRRKTPSTAWRARLVIVVLAAVVGLVWNYGFGASRGSSATSFAAGDEVVTSCGSGMAVAYTTAFDAADSGYAVSGIELSHIPAGCQGHSLSVTLYDSSGTAIGSPAEVTLDSVGTSQSIAIDPDSNNLDAGEVSGISVVVS